MKEKVKFIVGGALAIFIVVGLLFSLKKETYIVEFMVDNELYETEEVKDGGLVSEPDEPEKDGYLFEGWYLEEEKFDFDTKIVENLELDARWLKDDVETVVISFDTDGGNEISDSTIEINTSIKLPVPNKIGYVFEGWYVGDELVTNKTKFNKDSKLVARWKSIFVKEEIEEDQKEEVKQEEAKPIYYKVSFDTVGGEEIATQSILEGTVVVRPPDPIRDGYIFKGWFVTDELYDFSSLVSKDFTIVAKWEKKSDVYTITFTKYDQFSPFGVIQVFKNGGSTPVEFIELQDSNGNYIGKYNDSAKGLRNAYQDRYEVVSKLKLIDGTVVNISK